MSDERIERLEQSVRRIWMGLLAVTVALSVAVLGDVLSSKGLTLRELQIVDAEGKTRLVMGTSANGSAAFAAIDRNGKVVWSQGTD